MSVGSSTVSDIEIRPIGKGFGGEVLGVDAGSLSDEDFRRIEDAWFEHGVLVFRDLEMTPEQHVRLTKRFGPLHVMTPLEYNLPGHPEVLVLTNIQEGGKPKGIRRAGLGWHSDGEDKRIPNAGSFLYAIQIPDEGGDTLFADMRAVYQALPAQTRERIAGKRARFSRIDMHEIHYPLEPKLTEEQKRERPDVYHPIVRTHPRTGDRSLFVGRWARDIEGMDADEGFELVQELFRFAVQPQFVYRHKWRIRDAVLWDNRCTMHCATEFDEERYDRLMYRTTLEGEAPA
jgi:alpha-ketoglutarate-dependent taurine dioxygenase